MTQEKEKKRVDFEGCFAGLAFVFGKESVVRIGSIFLCTKKFDVFTACKGW